MQLSQILLPEFDQETANTRLVLERIPDRLQEWKAHERSNTVGWVGMHLADIPRWPMFILEQDALDIAPPGGEPYRVGQPVPVRQMLELLDANVAAGRSAIQRVTDEQLQQPWSLLKGGQAVFTMPRLTVLRSFVFNHMIHHRAHLCVYLRLNNLPVPGMYGPSGDE